MDRLRWGEQELLAVGAALGDAASGLANCGSPPPLGPLLAAAEVGSRIADYLDGLGAALRALAAAAESGRSTVFDLAGESTELDARAAMALGSGIARGSATRGGPR